VRHNKAGQERTRAHHLKLSTARLPWPDTGLLTCLSQYPTLRLRLPVMVGVCMLHWLVPSVTTLYL
jgi:hypothetical protein